MRIATKCPRSCSNICLVLACIIAFVLACPAAILAEDESGNPYNTENFKPALAVLAQDEKGFFHGFDNSGDRVLFLTSEGSDIDEDFEVHINLADFDGGNATTIYTNGTIDRFFTPPVFSHDGTMIVFAVKTRGEDNTLGKSINIIREHNGSWDSEEIVYSVEDNSLEYPSFSPDDSALIYYSTEDCPKWYQEGDLWKIDLETRERTRLTTDKKGGLWPSFGPDGDRITYLQYSESGNYELWIVDADGSDPRMLLDENWDPDHPTFMPDGNILLSLGRPSPYVKESSWPTIWLLDPDTEKLLQLFPLRYANLAGNTFPRASPDGTIVLCYHGFGEGSGPFYVEDPDGDGIWDDRDGDHVADVCDGAPDDPDAGYYVGSDDDGENGSFCFGNILIAACVIPLTIAGKRRPRME